MVDSSQLGQHQILGPNLPKVVISIYKCTPLLQSIWKTSDFETKLPKKYE